MIFAMVFLFLPRPGLFSMVLTIMIFKNNAGKSGLPFWDEFDFELDLMVAEAVENLILIEAWTEKNNLSSGSDEKPGRFSKLFRRYRFIYQNNNRLNCL